jgi:hypothetical protein
VRRVLVDGGEIPNDLTAYVGRIRRDAHETTDTEVARVLTAGYSEDQVYEVTVAAALGEGLRRLRAGLNAVAESARQAPFTDSADESWDDAEPAHSEPFTPTVIEDTVPLPTRAGAE